MFKYWSILLAMPRTGVDAARAGSFYCIGIDRHHNAEALKNANKIVKDLSELTLKEIIGLVEGR